MTNPLKIPIAIKFTALIAILTLVAMGWVSFEAVRVAGETQEIEINEKGLLALDLVVSRLEPEWVMSRQQDVLKEVVARTLESCQDRGVIDILVYDEEDFVLATGLGARSMRVSDPEDRSQIEYPPAREAGVEIMDFEFVYHGRETKPIRSFEKWLQYPDGESAARIGRAQVLLSETQIRQARQRVRNEMFTLTLATALAAGLGSFLLATFLARPIRMLVKDMQQVSLGNLDHKSEVSSPNELGDLARTFNQMTSNLREAQELKIAQRATEHELNLATRIQQRLLPSSVPKIPGFDVAAYYQAAQEVGGDYYDFLRIGQHDVGVVVADVSGKGVPASLIMTMTRSLLRLAARGSTSPVETVRAVNRTLSPDMSPGLFVTLLYFVINAPARMVRLVRAGHNGPLFYSARSRKLIHVNPRGIALGLDSGGNLFDSEIEARQFTFHGGDVLVSYTDGVTEAKNRDGEDYSQKRLARVLVENAGRTAPEIQEAILADIDTHRGDVERSDDLTLVVIKCTAAAPD